MSYIVELLSNAGVKIAQFCENECTCNIKRTINGEYSVAFVYFYRRGAENKSQYLSYWNPRLRVLNTKDSTDSQTFVLNIPEVAKRSDGVIEFKCYGDHTSIATMKSEVVAAEKDFKNATVNTVLNFILSYSLIDVGTIQPTQNVSIKISYETVMSAISKLVSLLKCEYSYSESDNELSLLTQLGDSAKYVNIMHGRNARSISKKVLNYNVKNFIYGVGGGSPPATIAGARHLIETVSTNIITLESSKVVPENDAWNGYRVQFKTGALSGNVYNITDSIHSESGDQFVLSSSVSSAAKGDSIIILDSVNNEVNYLKSLLSIQARNTVYDVYKNTLHGNLVNTIRSSDFSETYSSAICLNWVQFGSLLSASQNTTEVYIKYGTKSQHLTFNNSTSGILQIVQVTPGRFYTLFANVFVVSGIATMSITIGLKSYYVSTQSGESGWLELKFEGVYTGSETDVTVSFLSSTATNESNAEYYVDSVALMESVRGKDGSVESRSFVKNCEQTELWNETFDYLISKKDPVVEYKASFVDLFRIDPINYFMDKINIGDTVKLTDADLAITSVSARVTEMTFNPFRPELTEHTITTGVS